MDEFGHFGSIGGGVCMDAWGVGPFVVEVGKQSFRFEDSDRFGPSIINKNGEFKAKQPGERSPFWTAHRQWRKQGRRTKDDGVTCIYEGPKPTFYRKVGRKNLIVEDGEEGGDFIEIQSSLKETK